MSVGWGGGGRRVQTIERLVVDGNGATAADAARGTAVRRRA